MSGRSGQKARILAPSASHSRHFLVNQYQVNTLLIIADEFQGGIRAVQSIHPVSKMFQETTVNLQHFRFIINHENAFISNQKRVLIFLLGRKCCIPGRQDNGKPGPFPEGAVHPYLSAVVPDDAVGDGKAQTGAQSFFLVVK